MTKKKVVEKKKVKVADKSFYGTGKRKCAIARVWLFEGQGQITVNRYDASYYLKQDVLVDYIKQPLAKLNLLNKYDVVASVLGGGLVGQAGALRLGIARALLLMNEEFKSLLKSGGFLTRDSRVKERKKYGRKRARKGFQYRKR